MNPGQYLKNIILSKHFSVRSFSEQSDLSYDLICNVIYGKTKSPKVLTKICLALGISPETILDTTDFKTNVSTFVGIHAADHKLLSIRYLVAERLNCLNVTDGDNIISKITDATYYCSTKASITDEYILKNMIDAIVIYGIMESKIKDK